jgi:hypothetical protein
MHQQWYTTPSNTDNARMRTCRLCRGERPTLRVGKDWCVSDPSDDARLAEFARVVADGIDEALPGWVERSVEQILVAFSRRADESVMVEARAAGQRARDDIVPRVRTLLEADVDAQWTNPLAIVRAAVRYPTEVLRAAGVPPVVRDEQAERQFPDDDYDLTPTRLADIDPELHEPSLAWGAAKAFVMKARHRELGG